MNNKFFSMEFYGKYMVIISWAIALSPSVRHLGQFGCLASIYTFSNAIPSFNFLSAFDCIIHSMLLYYI